MVRTTLGAEVETRVEVNASESVDFVNLDQTESVAAQSTEQVTLTAPSGFLYSVIAFRFTLGSPGGSSSNAHQMVLKSASQQVAILAGTASADKPLNYERGDFTDANLSKRPGSASARQISLTGARFDDTNGLTINYNNLSNSTQTNDREIRLWLRRIQVS